MKIPRLVHVHFSIPVILCLLVSGQTAMLASDVTLDLVARAEHGEPAAQFELGNAYENRCRAPSDDSTPQGKKDAAEAVRWWRAAAEQGYADAEETMGTCYAGGFGVEKPDPVEAVNWWKKAAAHKNTDAYFDLGMAYSAGDGVVRDGKKALEWLRKAVDSGNFHAATMIGILYEKGECLPENDTEAMRWYRVAADHGDALSQYKLGRGYEYGNGVPPDRTVAIEWFRKAAYRGNKDAVAELQKLHAQP